MPSFSILYRDSEAPNVLVARNRLLKRTFRPIGESPRDTIAYSLSAEADALSDSPSKKGLQVQAFSKRLMGFEPTTFCMGKQLLPLASHPENACKSTGICAAHIEIGFQELRRNTRG